MKIFDLIHKLDTKHIFESDERYNVPTEVGKDASEVSDELDKIIKKLKAIKNDNYSDVDINELKKLRNATENLGVDISFLISLLKEAGIEKKSSMNDYKYDYILDYCRNNGKFNDDNASGLSDLYEAFLNIYNARNDGLAISLNDLTNNGEVLNLHELIQSRFNFPGESLNNFIDYDTLLAIVCNNGLLDSNSKYSLNIDGANVATFLRNNMKVQNELLLTNKAVKLASNAVKDFIDNIHELLNDTKLFKKIENFDKVINDIVSECCFNCTAEEIEENNKTLEKLILKLITAIDDYIFSLSLEVEDFSISSLFDVPNLDNDIRNAIVALYSNILCAHMDESILLSGISLYDYVYSYCNDALFIELGEMLHYGKCAEEANKIKLYKKLLAIDIICFKIKNDFDLALYIEAESELSFLIMFDNEDGTQISPEYVYEQINNVDINTFEPELKSYSLYTTGYKL